MKVRHILESKGTELFHVSPEESVTTAIGRMMGHKSGSLVVMEEERLAGIITERDVMRAVNRYGADLDSIMVREVMATDVVCCRDTDTLDEAMGLMIENPSKHGIRHLPVMDGERLAGMISMRDIIQALLTEIKFENRLLKNYIKNWPEEEEQS
jgi:CBS domain-containing protein